MLPPPVARINNHLEKDGLNKSNRLWAILANKYRTTGHKTRENGNGNDL